jgi:hypothetical protein
VITPGCPMRSSRKLTRKEHITMQGQDQTNALGLLQKCHVPDYYRLPNTDIVHTDRGHDLGHDLVAVARSCRSCMTLDRNPPYKD